MQRIHQKIALVVVSVGMMATAAVFATASSWHASTSLAILQPSAISPPQVDLQSADVMSAMARAGLTPDALSAAGLDNAQTTSIVNHAAAYMNDNISDWRAAEAAVKDAYAKLSQLQQPKMSIAIPAGQGQTTTPIDLAAIAPAQQTLQTAQAAMSAKVETARAAALQQIGTDAVAKLDLLRKNANREVPIQYLVVDRTDAEWVTLRDALSSVRYATKNNQTPDTDAQKIVSDADTASAVVAAKTGLDARKAEIAQSWENALKAIKP